MSPGGNSPSRPFATGVRVVGSRSGTSPHLVDLASRQATALCGVGVDFAAVGAWFGMAGCKKCARLAIGRGLSEVADIDGEVVQLQEVLARSW